MAPLTEFCVDDDFHCQIIETGKGLQSKNKYRNHIKMDSVTALHRELKTEYEKTAPNLRKCGNLLDQLKVIILIHLLLYIF